MKLNTLLLLIIIFLIIFISVWVYNYFSTKKQQLQSFLNQITNIPKSMTNLIPEEKINQIKTIVNNL